MWVRVRNRNTTLPVAVVAVVAALAVETVVELVMVAAVVVVVVIVVVVIVVVVMVDKGGFKHDGQRRHGIVERERTVVYVYNIQMK